MKTNRIGRVVYLNLSDRNLTGPIPPELGSLSELGELYLSSNNLVGSIPPELGNLSKLKKLSLGRNELSGSIPPELSNLTGLVSLDLLGNLIRSFALPSRWASLIACALTNNDAGVLMCSP